MSDLFGYNHRLQAMIGRTHAYWRSWLTTEGVRGFARQAMDEGALQHHPTNIASVWFTLSLSYSGTAIQTLPMSISNVLMPKDIPLHPIKALLWH